MPINLSGLIEDEATHPGKVLLDILEQGSLSYREFAAISGIEFEVLVCITRTLVDINPELAEKIAATMKAEKSGIFSNPLKLTDPNTWLMLQQIYDSGMNRIKEKSN